MVLRSQQIVTVENAMIVSDGHPDTQLLLRALDVVGDDWIGYPYESVREQHEEHIKHCEGCSLAMRMTMKSVARAKTLKTIGAITSTVS